MNYLAHIYLAGKEEELIAGNFMADAVKGSRYKKLSPKRIAAGITMHRAIDYFSDTHPAYLKSVHRLTPKHGKFSGIITDMFFDHLLASNWTNFSTVPLEQFSQNTYAILHKHCNHMTQKSRVLLGYMSKGNWLVSYKDMEGIQRALYGLSQRLKYYHPLQNAVSELEAYRAAYQDDFYTFFPLLQTFAKSFTFLQKP